MEPGAREDLPKVSIETEQDWRQIQHNLSTALLVRLDSELETSGQPRDKDSLLPHVHQFLEDLFDIARPNLRINGRTAREPYGEEDDVEPFDEALDRHIWSLSDQKLKWDKEIADRRRARPQDIEELVAESLVQHHSWNSEPLEKSDTHSDVDSKQVNSTARQTVFDAASAMAPLLQTLKLQRSRTERITLLSAEVRALKHRTSE